MPFRLLPTSAVILAALSAPVVVSAAAPVQASASGTVVRVNAAEGKIAIRHGAIPRLDLPAMILVYHADPALLAGVAVGQEVRFTAQRADGQYQIVELTK